VAPSSLRYAATSQLSTLGIIHAFMKRIIIFLAILLIACAASYRAGVLNTKKNTFVISLTALDQIRSGDVPNGTTAFEIVCFNAAETLYTDPIYRHDKVVKMFAPDLIKYRDTYCTNRAKLGPVLGQRLDEALADYK